MKKMFVLVVLGIALVGLMFSCRDKGSSPTPPVIQAPAPLNCQDTIKGIFYWSPSSVVDNGTVITPKGYMVRCINGSTEVDIDAGDTLQIDVKPWLTTDGAWTLQVKAYSDTRDGDWSNAVVIVRKDGCFSN